MPFKIFSICFLLFSTTIFAQNGFQKNPKVEQYYFFQNNAELAIVDSNYAEAIVFYKKAFTFKNPDPRALFNGLRLGLTMNDSAFANACIDNFASNGFPKEHLENFLKGTGTLETTLYQQISKDYTAQFQQFQNQKKQNWVYF